MTSEKAASTKRKSIFLNLKLPELSSGGLLVLQSGSFGLRAAIFKTDKESAHNYASIKAFAYSRQVDFTRAIAEITLQLKKEYGSVPKRCVLISPSLVSAILSLPVSPVKPKANGDMQELIRWEIDGAQNDDAKQWLIGSMLVERGYLTPNQREEIITELHIRQDMGGDAALTCFGDLAVELTYLTKEQLQECSLLQNKLVDVEQDFIFGYQAELSEDAADQEFSGLTDEVLSTGSDSQSNHNWLVAGLARGIRKHWHGAFALNGLKLEAFYPNNGASFSALGLRSEDNKQCLIEVHTSHLVFVQGSNKNVKHINSKARHDGNLTLDEVLAICPENLSQDYNYLYIYSPDDSLDELSFALAEHLQIEVRPLVQGEPSFALPQHFSASNLLPFIGVANHFLNFSEQGRACSVMAKDKEPPLWQKLTQPKVMIGMAASVVLSIAVGFIIWMQMNLATQQERLISLEKRWSEENKVKQQYSKVQSQYSQLSQKITEIEAEIKQNEKLTKYLTKELLPASTNVPGALSAIANSINKGVLIEQVSLQTDVITIDGRALKTSNASEFAQQLNENLKPWRYQVGDTQSVAANDSTSEKVFLNYKMRLEIGRRYFIDEEEKTLNSKINTGKSE